MGSQFTVWWGLCLNSQSDGVSMHSLMWLCWNSQYGGVMFEFTFWFWGSQFISSCISRSHAFFWWILQIRRVCDSDQVVHVMCWLIGDIVVIYILNTIFTTTTCYVLTYRRYSSNIYILNTIFTITTCYVLTCSLSRVRRKSHTIHVFYVE